MRGRSLFPVLIVVAALLACGCKESPETNSQDSELALQGGIEIVLETDTEQRDKVYAILLRRAEESSLPKPIVQKQGESRIVIHVPGATDVERYKRLMTQRAAVVWMLVAEDLLVLDESNRWSSERLLETYDRAVAELPDRGPDPSRPDDPEAIVPYKDDQGDLVNFEAFDKKLRDEEDRIPPDTILRLSEGVDGRGDTVRTPLLLRSSEDQPCVVSGDDLRPESCTVARGRYGDPQVKFEIGNAEARKRFEDVTEQYSAGSDNSIGAAPGERRGWRLAILLDDKVLSAPHIQMKISDGKGIIAGVDTFAEAFLLAAQLRSGSLPKTVRVVQVRTVPPDTEAK